MQPFISTIIAAGRRFEAIGNTAQACRLRFNWSKARNPVPLPFLDADVVCGSLYSLSLGRKLDQLSEGNLLPSDPSIIGPHSLRYCLSSLKHFTIPPGAVAELFKQKEALTGSISGRARKFIQSLKSNSPYGLPANSATFLDASLVETLKSELLQIATENDDIELLDELVTKALPIEFLIKQQPDPIEVRHTYDQTYNLLTARRPNKALSNFNDALNVAIFVKSFLTEDAKEKDAFFVTGTSQILDFNGSLNALLHIPTESPALIRPYLYLIVDAALNKHAFGQPEVVTVEATLLWKDSIELSSLCQVLAEKGRNLEKKGSFKIETLSNEIDLLGIKMKGYAQRWRFIFENYRENAGRDISDTLNVLFSGSLSRDLNSNHKERMTTGLRQLESKLRSLSNPYTDLWRLLNEYASLCERPTFVDERIDFAIGVVENKARCLSEIQWQYEPKKRSFHKVAQGEQPGQQRFDVLDLDLHASTSDMLRDSHNLRAYAHVPYLTSAAIIALDSWKDIGDKDRSLAAIWQHNSDFKEVWRSCLRCVGAATHVFVKKDVYDFMYVKDGMPVVGNAFFGQQVDDLKIAADVSEISYFEISFNDVTVFGDIKTYASTERQMGVAFRQNHWNRNFMNTLANVNGIINKHPCSEKQFLKLISRLGAVMSLIELQ
jgi:hypothetical protein